MLRVGGIIRNFEVVKIIPFRTSSKAKRNAKVKERRKLEVKCLTCQTVVVEYYRAVMKGKQCKVCPRTYSRRKPMDLELDNDLPLFYEKKACDVCQGKLELKYWKVCSKCRKDVKFKIKDGTQTYLSEIPDEYVYMVW